MRVRICSAWFLRPFMNQLRWHAVDYLIVAWTQNGIAW